MDRRRERIQHGTRNRPHGTQTPPSPMSHSCSSEAAAWTSPVVVRSMIDMDGPASWSLWPYANSPDGANDAELPMFPSAIACAASASDLPVSVACGLVEHPLIGHEIWVLRSNGHHGLLSREFAVDLALRQPVMHAEGAVVALLFLRRNAETGGGGYSSAMTSLKCTCACSMVKPEWTERGRGCRLVVGRLLHHWVVSAHLRRVHQQVGLLRRARWAYQLAARPANSCFRSPERLCHTHGHG